MKNLDLLDLLEKRKRTRLDHAGEGSIEHAMVRASCAARRLIDLPAWLQSEIVNSAREEGECNTTRTVQSG
jgi:hypothetical protein